MNNLCSGTYTVTVRDNNSLIGTESVSIPEPPPIVVTTTTASGQNNCTVSSTAVVTCLTGINELGYEINFSMFPTLPQVGTTLC